MAIQFREVVRREPIALQRLWLWMPPVRSLTSIKCAGLTHLTAIPQAKLALGS